MAGDDEIQKSFETADDAMQALWGLHSYVRAAESISSRDEILARLPHGTFQMTHHWQRIYSPEELVDEMQKVFEFVHSRSSLTALVALFEAATERFIERLVLLGEVKPVTNRYSQQLAWLTDLVTGTNAGSKEMRSRLPITLGDVDNARRLRNECVHNNGKFSPKYFSDALTVAGLSRQDESAARTGDPIQLTHHRFEYFCRSHLDLLHIAHITIQRKWFDPGFDYNYAAEGKRIEWCRILDP